MAETDTVERTHTQTVAILSFSSPSFCLLWWSVFGIAHTSEESHLSHHYLVVEIARTTGKQSDNSTSKESTLRWTQIVRLRGRRNHRRGLRRIPEEQ